MDFLTAASAPIAITIDGTPYTIQRMLLPDLAAWAAGERKKVLDLALSVFKDEDQKARFTINFQPPRVDVFDVAAFAESVDGAPQILRLAWKKAGVPAEVIEKVIANAEIKDLGKHAVEIVSAKQAAAQAASMSEKSADPLAGQTGASGASPGTSQTNSQSTEPTTTPTPTA